MIQPSSTLGVVLFPSGPDQHEKSDEDQHDPQEQEERQYRPRKSRKLRAIMAMARSIEATAISGLEPKTIGIGPIIRTPPRFVSPCAKDCRRDTAMRISPRITRSQPIARLMSFSISSQTIRAFCAILPTV